MQALDLKGYIKNIKKALKYDHLYSDEELRKMKNDLRNLQKTKEMLRTYQNNGFGQYLNSPKPVEVVSTTTSVEEEDDVQSVDVEVIGSDE